MTLVLADTSVWARRDQRAVARQLATAIARNSLVLVLPITLELLRAARDSASWRTRFRQYQALHHVELTPAIARRALAVQGALAARGYHRGAAPTDLIAAAAAEAVGAELWHCDRHFELIAEVTGQAVRRVGS